MTRSQVKAIPIGIIITELIVTLDEQQIKDSSIDEIKKKVKD